MGAKQKIKELREEYLGQEVRLLDLDNRIESMVGVANNSIYDGDTEQYILLGEYNYWVEDGKEIMVEFEVVNIGEDEKYLETVVKVTGIDAFYI